MVTRNFLKLHLPSNTPNACCNHFQRSLGLGCLTEYFMMHLQLLWPSRFLGNPFGYTTNSQGLSLKEQIKHDALKF